MSESILYRFKKYFQNGEGPYMVLARLGLKNNESDEVYLGHLYKAYFGRNLNLQNPNTFNEKLNWLKIHDRNPLYSRMVDKYEVKSYISDLIGSKYIVPTIGLYNSFDEIDFSKLPDKFVLKCTHDSGGGIIVKDKSKLDVSKSRKKIETHLKKNFYYADREWPYLNIKPRIIAEMLLEDEHQAGINDYKVFCFNGIPKIIEVDFDRFTNHKRNLYTTDWEFMDFSIQYPNAPTVKNEKPKCLQEVLALASKISENIAHLRVDFYIVNNQIYFGEATFFHEGGFGNFSPESYDKKLGDWIDLSCVREY